MHRRILLLITDLQIGGTPTVVRELATRLRDPASHVHVEVACLSEWGPVADQITDAGVRVTALGARGSHHLPRTVHRLDTLIGSRLIDTCFSFLVHANAVAAVSSLFMHDVRYYQSVQTTQPEPRWHWTVQRFVHHAAHKVVVPSPSVAHAAHVWSGIPDDKLVVIPNAVDAAAFSATPRPPSGGRPYRVGFIGRLDPIKRIPDLLAALELLPADVELHIYGEGPERATIQSILRERQSSIGPRVTLHGAIPDPQSALSRIDTLVLPSAAEGFGLVLIEAMAAGVPVIATDVPGIRDVVSDGATGLLVPVASPPRLAQAIRQIRADESLPAALVERARAEVVHRFSWDTVIRQYRQVLELD